MEQSKYDINDITCIFNASLIGTPKKIIFFNHRKFRIHVETFNDCLYIWTILDKFDNILETRSEFIKSIEFNKLVKKLKVKINENYIRQY